MKPPNEHELRVARVEALLQQARDELAPLSGASGPLCSACNLFVNFADASIADALRQLGTTRGHGVTKPREPA